MRRALLTILFIFIGGSMQASALVISEVMSNPTGDDSGREWVELYNDTTSSVDLSSLTISIKAATAIAVTPLSGGTSLPAGGYAIIGSTVSGSTKFLQDYPTYTGLLFKSAISLVNTGVTSIDIKINGVTVNSLPSYTAAKEGSTLSLIGGSFVLSLPTPGADNQADSGSSSGGSSQTTTTNQGTVSQMAPPSSDIVLYVPFEKTVIAGAETSFEAYALTHAGASINGLTCTWAYGDGGQGTGATTTYRYAYTGRYIAQVEGTNGAVAGVARMNVRVVAPDISIASVGNGKYGNYVDVTNPNPYDLELSQWKLTINGQAFPFPKNTILAGNSTTHFSGLAMGFASTTIVSGTPVKILFPNQEEVVSYSMPTLVQISVTTATPTVAIGTSTSLVRKAVAAYLKKNSTVANAASTSSVQMQTNATSTVNSFHRDTRIVSWLKAIFN